jgi:hypothetical protein
MWLDWFYLMLSFIKDCFLEVKGWNSGANDELFPNIFENPDIFLSYHPGKSILYLEKIWLLNNNWFIGILFKKLLSLYASSSLYLWKEEEKKLLLRLLF